MRDDARHSGSLSYGDGEVDYLVRALECTVVQRVRGAAGRFACDFLADSECEPYWRWRLILRSTTQRHEDIRKVEPNDILV